MDNSIASMLSNSSDTAKLKLAVTSGEAAARQETVEQFEALFLQNMLKSMRTASLSSGLFESDGQKFYREMYDQQIATELAGRGILGIGTLLGQQLGLADQQVNSQLPGTEKVLYRARSLYVDPQPSLLKDSHPAEKSDQAATQSISEAGKNDSPAFMPRSPAEFVSHVKRFAVQAAEKLGIDYTAVMGIAALETGWGRHVPRDLASGVSNNYFGIKADTKWPGSRVVSDTLEHVNGAFEKFRETFRSYDSLADSFNDFADFLLSNPRYQDALNQGKNTEKFLTKLQEAGYATDPEYGQKVMRVIRHALSLQ